MQVTKILELLNAAKGKKASEFTEAQCKAIYEAAHSPHEDLNSQAYMVVHEGLKKWEYETIKHYGNGATSTHDYDDYMQDFFLQIMLHLKEWDPKKGKLITFFNYWLVKSCLKTRSFGANRTLYYNEVSLDMDKAKEILRDKGNSNPTYEEMKDALETIGVYRSVKTLRDSVEKQIDTVSLDAALDVPSAFENLSTDSTYSDKFVAAVSKIAPKYQRVMEIECRYHSELHEKTKLSEDEFYKELKKIYPEITRKSAKALRKNAHSEFRVRYYDGEHEELVI